jgi:hypothetical protein
LPGLVRQRCVMAPRPRLNDVVVSVRGEVGVTLGCSIALVTEKRLDVIERHSVDHQPARRYVAHYPGREAADVRSLDGRVPDAVPEVPVIHGGRLPRQ